MCYQMVEMYSHRKRTHVGDFQGPRERGEQLPVPQEQLSAGETAQLYGQRLRGVLLFDLVLSPMHAGEILIFDFSRRLPSRFEPPHLPLLRAMPPNKPHFGGGESGVASGSMVPRGGNRKKQLKLERWWAPTPKSKSPRRQG